MRVRPLMWVLVAVAASIVINLGLLGLASLLSKERGLPQDITDPIGVRLVTLAPPEVQEREEVKEPEKPKPQKSADFTPDLLRPQLMSQGSMDVGVTIDLGGLGGPDVGEGFVFEAYELDQPPQVVVRVPPMYPYKAREQGIEGAVQVKMLVNADGTVGQVIILDARPKGLFEDAVLKAVPQWKFSPGKIEGEAVTAWVITTLRFEF